MERNNAGRAAVITASLVVAFLALGCGEQKQGAKVETSAIPAAAVEQSSGAVVAATGTITPEAGITSTTEEGGTIETIPPDVTATGPDSLVAPGSIVEITAQASTDAQSLMLMDRLGHKYPFTYDVDAKAWTVRYRVPLTTTIDRLGLSVTATSDANRFKRVWVFLKIEGGVPQESDGC